MCRGTWMSHGSRSTARDQISDAATNVDMTKSSRPTSALFAAALLALAVEGVVAADFPTTVLSLNPLAYWRFNETTPSPSPPMVTNSSTLGAVGTGYVVDAIQG